MPPCTCTARSTARPTISVQNSFADDGPTEVSSPLSYRAATSRTRLRPASSSACMSASIAWTSWKRPIGAPPCLAVAARSEEHTSELQSHSHLVCRVLLDKKTSRVLLSPTHLAYPTSIVNST